MYTHQPLGEPLKEKPSNSDDLPESAEEEEASNLTQSLPITSLASHVDNGPLEKKKKKMSKTYAEALASTPQTTRFGKTSNAPTRIVLHPILSQDSSELMSILLP